MYKVYYGIYDENGGSIKYNKNKKEKRMENAKWVTDSMKPLLKVLSQYEEKLTTLLSLLGEFRDSEAFKKAILPSVDFYTQRVQTYSDMLLKVVSENTVYKPEAVPAVEVKEAKEKVSGKKK